ncbi:MAG TPA: HD domain-containing protein [Anaerolineales bacterium]
MSRKDDEAGSAYAGRWVARVAGQIVAHGGTPEEAREAAQKSRYKERAEISFVPPAISPSLSPLVEQVHAALRDQEIYLVGGAVRDALLGHVSHDLDFAVPKNAIAVARRVANALKADFYILDESFDAARVIVQAGSDGGAPGRQGAARAERDVLDFSSFRKPAGSFRSGPEPTLEADQRGRDFTINSLAFDLRSRVILDPLHGAADLRSKVIRSCSAGAMQDDPVRIMRGVRLAASLGFKIDPSTREAMKAAVSGLRRISAERQRDELFKTLEGRRPDASLRALEMLGALPYMMPELSDMKGVTQSAPHVADVWEHTLSVLQYLESTLGALGVNFEAERNNDLFTGLLSLRLGRYREHFAAHFANGFTPDRSVRALLFFAALYHDIAKPASKTVEAGGRIRFLGHEGAGAEVAARRAKAFNLSNDEIGRVQTIVANHMRLHFHASRLEEDKQQPSRKSIYRFFRDTGEAGVDLIVLGLADLRGVRGRTLTQETWSSGLDVARLFLENYWEKPEETVAPPRLINGDQLMQELDLQSGPVVGELLAAIREAQASGELSSREDAIRYAQEWIRNSTRPPKDLGAES